MLYIKVPEVLLAGPQELQVGILPTTDTGDLQVQIWIPTVKVRGDAEIVAAHLIQVGENIEHCAVTW